MDLGEHLDLTRCPHCHVARPTLARVLGAHVSSNHKGGDVRKWVGYQCKSCGGLVIAAAPMTSNNKTLPICEIYPAPEEIEEEVPKRARHYLEQAIESLSAPDGAVMLAASAVDAMLKEKGYKNGTLNERIKQAAQDHVITPDMETWAHQVRIDANDPRHADDENPHHDEASAKQAVDFARALAQFMFVLPARVTRGIKATSRAPRT
jgi:Domain of unknown function (DUF4145)